MSKNMNLSTPNKTIPLGSKTRQPDPKPSFFRPYLKQKILFLMFIPGLIYYIVFQYLPMYGLIISFKDFQIMNGILASPWVGLKHFQLAFVSSEFWSVFTNTLVISFLKLLFSFPASIVLALLLNEVDCLKFKKTVQTATYLPHFLSWVVLSGIVINFLSPSSGPVNALLSFLGIKPIYFIGSLQWFRPVLILSTIWKEIGWNTIIYLAALANVNPELYEAATVDGAGRLKQTFHITLPAITPVITIMFIFAVGGIVNDDFDQIYNLYNPAVYSVGDVLSTYIYRMGLENMLYSYTAALGFFKNMIAFGLIVATNYFARHFGEYGLW